MKKIYSIWSLFLIVILFSGTALFAQVTTSSITGTVHDNSGTPLPAATVMAVHVPSGTTYGTTTREDGRFSLPGMRVGGPYSVAVTFVGYQKQVKEDIHLALGVARNIEFVMHGENIKLDEITITGEKDAIFSPERTGASTSIDLSTIKALPTISRRIDDFVRLSPQAKRTPFGGFYFAGQDNRLNNITVDGSYFNNSFGLGGQPGDRTGVAPISLDAIEQVQVNVAPFDVRQGNFVGAGINTVTKSGTNLYTGSVYYQFRHQGLVGQEAKDRLVDPGRFKYNQIGVNLGGPIIKNKLFFFGSFEQDQLTQPGTTYEANRTGATPGGNITRVAASDLDQLSSFLKTNFGYETGPYDKYDHEIPATRFLMRMDYNLDQRNKISLRYTHLDSKTDVLLSNSSSLGFGNRRSRTDALNFQNSNYLILENIRSLVGEWNSNMGNLSNNFIVGYTYNDESRDSRGTMFPFVDILKEGAVYTSFGFEPFTPNNELRYKSFQIQDNLTYFMTDHYLTFGFSAERYESENVFYPGSQSVYVYNSLEDFYADANGYLQNPNRTTSDNTLKRFQVRWSNQPGMDKPVQPLEVWYAGLYAQDEWQVLPNFRLTGGFRVDLPMFGETGFANAEVDAMNFMDENGNTVKYSTSKLPDANPLLSPRIGFNWDIFENQTTQLRGGTGIFTSRPAYVWISNQIGNNGVLTGFQRLDDTKDRPFNPNPNTYKPASVNGDPASNYELAFTDPDFKFPQLWRSTIAVDQKLPFGLIGTVDFLYNRDVNGIYYINANLTAPDAAFNGVDNRPRWSDPKKNKINSKIDNAIVLKNQNEGYSWNFSAAIERPFSNGLYAKLAYSYGESKNTIDPGSIAFGSWNNNQHAGNPNKPGLGFSAASAGHRILAAVSYRKEYFDFGGTSIALFVDGSSPLNGSYTFTGDLNGDGGTSNDLIYIHKDISEMNFQTYTEKVKGEDVTFTAEQQAAAWDAYIEQDDYLKANRGKYAERGGVFLPMVFRADLSLIQEVFTDIIGAKNTLQFRIDFLNITNWLNKEWGVSDRFYGGNTQPLIARGADAQGNATYRMKQVGGQLLTKSIESNAEIADVYSIQFGIRYIFN